MRILMSADTVGGVWNYALELARGLCRAGDEVVIAALGGRMSAAQAAAAAAVPGLTVRDSDFPLEWMDSPWQGLAEAGAWLAELAAEARPDLVQLNHFAHADVPWNAPVLRVVHSCVYSWHWAVRGHAPEPERWDRYRQEVRRGLRTARMVLAPSAFMLRQAERHYGPFRDGGVIHNGRRGEDFPPRRKRNEILSAGRLWDEAKNVAALARIAPALPWPVRVAGASRHPDGGAAGMPGVELLGLLSPAELAAAYGRAAIYALPARYEPFGLSVLEAALAGCVLVLGDIPSLRELWEGAALFVPPQDEAALRDTLRWLIADPELRCVYAQRARDRAAVYGAERMVSAYRDIYRQLTDESRARPARQTG